MDYQIVGFGYDGNHTDESHFFIANTMGEGMKQLLTP